MSDIFADEFEKWLKNNPDARRTEETEEEDSNDASGNESESTTNTTHSGESESGKLKKNLPDRLGSKVMSVSLSDQAPILLDDDDDDLSPSKKQQYEDEPPILEPVPRQLQNCQISNVGSQQFCPQSCMRNYSRNHQMYPRKPLLGDQKKYMKTYSNKDKVNYTAPVACVKSCQRNSWKSEGSKRSGNIFDTFISDSCEDCPPPLIPSPDALEIDSESSSSTSKHPSYSPDFCAMEADSTSEMNDDRVGSVFHSQRSSKNSVHEVSVECDSTCMLAASPVIVSPASFCNSDMEGTRDSAEGGNKDDDMESSIYKSNKIDNNFAENTENERQSKLMQITIKQDSLVNNFDKDSVLQITEELSSDAGLQKLGVNTLLNSNCESLLVTVNTHGQNNESDFPTEPPVLSAVSPSVRPHYMLRNKRHTIDSPETFPKSRKRQHITLSSQNHFEIADFDVSASPPLIHVSETVISRSRRSKLECHGCHQNKNLCRRRKRCNTLPITDLSEYYSSLTEDVRNFVIGTSELSNLQTHMHKLLSQLFPQLKAELDTMSPESFKFESLLSDLVKLLEQTDEQDRSMPPTLMLAVDIKPAPINECSNPLSVISELDNTSQSISDKPCSPSVTTSDSQAAAVFAKQILKSDAISFNHSSQLLLSNGNSHDYQQKQCQQKKTEQSTSQAREDLVIPLSQLNVRETEEILTPFKVLLCKNPEKMIDSFIQLSCRALQLLLPDLTVSLNSELAQYPQDLIVFINNVMLTNSRRH